MAHVKGHINVPAREMKESETKIVSLNLLKINYQNLNLKEPVIVKPDKIEIKVLKIVVKLLNTNDKKFKAHVEHERIQKEF